MEYNISVLKKLGLTTIKYDERSSGVSAILHRRCWGYSPESVSRMA